MFIKYSEIDNSYIQYLAFIGENIHVINENHINHKKIFHNPLIKGIDGIEIKKYKDIEYQYEILNEVCNIDIGKISNKLNMSNIDCLYYCLNRVFGKFMIYNITNLNELDDNNIKNIYQNVANKYGNIMKCHSVNNIDSDYSISRDIKYIPNTNHFYSSNIAQPLHTDYAYYPYNKAPDWLMLYCLQKSEFGGITSLITTNKIVNILSKYNKKLLDTLYTDFEYIYTEINKNDINHNKYLLNDKNYMNWNYFQIKNTDSEHLNIKNNFKKFTDEILSQGHICTISKKWKKGDCVIFNDHLVLHERSAFLGERWLKDHAFFDKKLKL